MIEAMRNLITATAVLAGLGLLAMSAPVSATALSCVTGNNTITVDSSSGCVPAPGQNDDNVDENALVFNPGDLGPYEWTYLDNDISDPGAGHSGDFTIDVASYAESTYDTYMVHLKAGNDGVYFLLDRPVVDGLLNGSFSVTGLPGCTRGNCVNGNPVAHIALYGALSATEDDSTAVPEPGALGLLGLGLLSLGAAHRRKLR
jgi:hypothetical protein